MTEIWRYADRMAAAQTPVKRMRSEFDDLNPAGAGYFSREEPRLDDQNSGLTLREQESLGMIYGSGLTGAHLSGLSSGHLKLDGLGATNVSFPTHSDSSLLGLGGGRMLGLDSGIGKPSTSDLNNGRPDYLARQDSQGPPRPHESLPLGASSTLFVEGLPTDCSQREVAHVFRPFYGLKEVRLARKKQGINLISRAKILSLYACNFLIPLAPKMDDIYGALVVIIVVFATDCVSSGLKIRLTGMTSLDMECQKYCNIFRILRNFPPETL